MHEVRERFGRQVCYLSAWLGFDEKGKKLKINKNNNKNKK